MLQNLLPIKYFKIFYVQKNRDSEKPSTNILHIAHLDDSVTKHIIWRTVRWRGLAQPRDIRMVECGGGQSSAFLEFRTNAEAEAVMDEFNCRLFSEEDNISFLNLSTRKGKELVIHFENKKFLSIHNPHRYLARKIFKCVYLSLFKITNCFFKVPIKLYQLIVLTGKKSSPGDHEYSLKNLICKLSFAGCPCAPI